MKKVFVFDLPFFDGTLSECVDLLTQRLHQKAAALPLVVFTLNPEQLVIARRDNSFRKMATKADLLLPDGEGVVLASRVFHLIDQKPSLKERIPGRKVVAAVLKDVAADKVLVIGGRDYATKNGARNPKLGFYWSEGYRDVQHPTEAETHALTTLIQKIQPQLIFVAFGAPQQEGFIMSFLDTFVDNKVAVAMAVGGTFDILTGKLKTAPHVIEALKLEWAFRLWQEPWRWKRQLRLLSFGWLTITVCLRKLLARFFFSGVHSE